MEIDETFPAAPRVCGPAVKSLECQPLVLVQKTAAWKRRFSRSHLLYREHQLYIARLLERVCFGWCEFLMFQSLETPF
jgi:hypothetical protein